VLNGTTTPGLAQRVSDQLTARGYAVQGVGTSPTKPSQTQLRYGTGADQQAAALAQVAPSSKPIPNPSVTSGVVNLILGADWEGLKGAQPAAIPKTAGAVNAADDVCKAQ
jgi:LytR cell envelope-related transcriptional attenuator